jgi:hypothetical protein
MHSQYLNFQTFSLLLPATCFSYSLDHLQIVKMQVQKGITLQKGTYFTIYLQKCIKCYTQESNEKIKHNHFLYIRIYVLCFIKLKFE